jgi:glycosyltransferase involved in cell wall biosynthesis
LIPALKKRARIGILDHMGPMLGGAQLVVSHMAAILSHDYEVELIHNGEPHDIASLVTAFLVDLGRVKERTVAELSPSFGVQGVRALLQSDGRLTRSLSEPYDLFIYSGHGIPPACFARRGLVYCHFPFESAPLNWLKGNIPVSWQNRLAHLVKAGAYRRIWRKRMQGYQQVFANSQFTAEWVQRRWGRSAEVLYPPVDLHPPASEKLNLIVTLGSFTGDRRSKNQLEQVTAFAAFLKQVEDPWKLRIVGLCSELGADRDYLSAVQKAASGLPVELLVNVDREVAIRSLAEAKLFWHTTGLSIEEAKWPELAEHFGIATVEAMRARCVPIVIASGGQREIIEHEKSGFLARDLNELIETSVKIAGNDERLDLIAGSAKRRSALFAQDSFNRRLMSAVSECLRS